MIDRLKMIWKYIKLTLLYVLLTSMFIGLFFYLFIGVIIWFICGKDIMEWYIRQVDKLAEKIYEQSK